MLYNPRRMVNSKLIEKFYIIKLFINTIETKANLKRVICFPIAVGLANIKL